MKLKIRAITNQNVSIGVFDYPPYSTLECEIDSKHLPTYAKAFEEWEIIDEIPVKVEVEDYKLNEVEKEDDKEDTEQVEVKSNRKNPTKARTKQS